MNKKSIAWILIVAGMFVACNIYTLIPIYPIISNEWDVDTMTLTLGSTSFTMMYALGLLLFGPLSDRIGRKVIIVIGMLLYSISSLLVSFSNSPMELVVLRGVQGYTGGSFAPVAFAYLFELYNGKFRILALSLINTGFLVAGILGQVISAGLTELLNWESVYLFFSMIYFLFFLCFIIMLPRSLSSSPSQKMIPINLMVSLFTSKQLLKCYIITFSLLLTTVAFYDSVSQYFDDMLTSSEMYIVRGIGLIGAVLSIWGGTIQAKYKDKGSLLIGFSLLILSMSIMIAFPNFYVITFCSILIIAAISILIPTIISIIGIIGNGNRGTAIALYSFTLLLGASFGALLTSFFSFRGVLVFLLLFALTNFILTLKISYPNSSY